MTREAYQEYWNEGLRRGFKPGWSAYQYKEEFGQWPPWRWRDEAEAKAAETEPCEHCKGTGRVKKERPRDPPRYSGGSPWWAVLGVNRWSNEATVKAAFADLAMRYHPDRGGDGDTMSRINAAYAAWKRERA